MSAKNQTDRLKELKAYKFIEERTIEELDSLGIVMEHKKTGARLFLLLNSDDNKVFNIGFRTPPKDSTGVPHIMEHSVLCGSDKFPVKDPFVELVKGSLNTFLNAMTYPDKTVYPVASTNAKDFNNLMDVYMDAVLHPNIYKEENIFRQEGWHYELEKKEEDPFYNGVVYNEMKGVYSSPESVLDQYTRHILFPDNCYGFESGGDPEYIPDLTYEQFLDFHRKYYHPSNSYIYLYGNMDMAERLNWLDENYLSMYEKTAIDSTIAVQKAFTEPKDARIYYSITDGQSQKGAAYLSVNTVVGTDLDPKLYVAFQILEYTLIDAPGAPLKQALLDAGIGRDIMGGYESGILQPYFSIVSKDADEEQKGEFLAVVKGTLRKLAEEGIDRKSLLAGLNYYEFKYREADYGSTPKGLMYGLQCMDSWLYDGDPMLHLQYQKTFDDLKNAVAHGYFENIIKEYLLDNPHEAVITVIPKKNLTAEDEKKLAEKLAEYKKSLSPEQINNMIETANNLKIYQSTQSPQSDLEKIPLLKRSDIERKAEKLIWTEDTVDGIKVIHHNMHTSGIGYLSVMFNTNCMDEEELKYTGFLKTVLGYVNTKNHTYSDLTSEIYLNSGGLNFSVTSYPDLENYDEYTGVFTASIRVLYDKLDFGFSIIREILSTSVIDDEKRIGEILGETKSRGKMKLEMSGHAAALSRATSYFSPTAYYNELTGGIEYYKFIEQLSKDYEKDKKTVIEKLKSVCRKLFRTDNMLISYTSDSKGYAYLKDTLHLLTDGLLSEVLPACHIQNKVENLNEGFKTSSQVNYVSRCGNFKFSGLKYTGALKVLKVILSYDYLWTNVRVKGGAYGCMSGFGRSGEGYLLSYRDPNVKETNEIYEGIVQYLKTFDVSERDMTKFVIGTISDLDMPLTPAARGARGLSAYLSKVTDEMMQTERDEVLNVTVEDIRALADTVKAVLDTGSICVIGNEEKIMASAGLFKNIKDLFG